jgi:hypothetical protein
MDTLARPIDQNNPDFYVKGEQAEFFDFLSKNAYLFPLVTQAYHNIKLYFTNSPVALELITDPEEPKTSQIAMKVLIKDLSPHAAVKKLRDFDQDWWLDNLPLAKNKLVIQLESAR